MSWEDIVPNLARWLMLAYLLWVTIRLQIRVDSLERRMEDE